MAENEHEEERSPGIVKGMELLFETPPERMKELTTIGKRQSLSMSLMRTWDDLQDFLSDNMENVSRRRAGREEDPPKQASEFMLSASYLNYYESYQRSVDGKHARFLAELTMAQIEVEEENDDEDKWKD